VLSKSYIHLKVETKNSEKMHLNYAVNVDLLVNTLLSIPCKELSWSAGSGEIDFFLNLIIFFNFQCIFVIFVLGQGHSPSLKQF
jgi:hypothetical protein